MQTESAHAPAPTCTAPPGPRGLPLLGVAPWLLRDPFGFCTKAALQFDGLAQLAVGPIKVLVVSHPDYVQHILVTNARNYGKGAIMDGIRAALGDGLFTADGDLWRLQRRLIQPTFHQERIQEMVETIREETVRQMDSWEPSIERGAPVDLLREIILLNIRVVLRTLFGATVQAEQANEMIEATNGVFAGMSRRVYSFFMPRWLPLPGQRAFQRAIATLDEMVSRIIAERRRAGTQASDLLGALLAARVEETSEGMSDRQLRDEIFTLFVAGYESTASSVSWMFYLLSQHPDVARRLRAELDAELGDRDPAFDDLGRLEYLRRVVDEGFRIYPAFPMYFRTSIEGDTVGPYAIPRNASIIISPYATQHDPRYWSDPERFDPERFTPPRFTESAAKAYYPFGKGQRICIGKGMALATAQMVIAMILRRFEIELAPGKKVEPWFALTLQPRNGMQMVLAPRGGQRKQ